MSRCGYLLLSLLLVLVTASSVWADAADDAYARARARYQNLQASESQQQLRHHWERTIKGFEAVYRAYPRSHRAPDALFMAGRSWQGLYEHSHSADDARAAIASYDDLADRFSRDNLADDALYLGAELARKLEDFPGAYLRYQRLLDDYPKGDMRVKAQVGLDQLTRLQPAAATPEPVAGSPPASPSTVVAAPAVAAAGTARMEGVRFWSNPSYTRIVLDLDRPASYSANVLGSSSAGGPGLRLYLDLARVQPAPAVPASLDVRDGLLTRIRTGVDTDGTTRVVLDLNSLDDYKIFSLSNPHRVVIDVRGKTDGATVASSSPAPAPGGPDALGALLRGDKSPGTAVSNTSAHGVPRIVIDAGHGGKDPGAIGSSGVQEKNITLALALALEKELKKAFPCDVILTRRTDVYLPLEERTAIANKVRADLFISLHINAAPSRSAYGIETYFLNLAKNNQAAELAARENDTTLQEVSNLEAILFDLMANAKINESSRLAQEIQEHLVRNLDRHYTKIKDLGVRQGPFYVLLGATMPSVLVETGFISHPREEKRLNTTKFRQHTVEAISQGIGSYARAMNMVAKR